MGLLDIILLILGWLAWVGAFLSWSDSLYKLFLWLCIWFLMYVVVALQVEITGFLSPSSYDWYQNFLANNATGLLTSLLFWVPILWIVFMFNSRLSFATRPKSISQLLLWLLLPIFLIWMISYLAEGSILAESVMWQKVFEFLEWSGIYNIFRKLPWGIFLLLGFLIFYKSLFILAYSFIMWLWTEVILQFFRSWKDEREKMNKEREEEIEE